MNEGNSYIQSIVRQSVNTAYLWMGLGLLVTAVVSILMFSSGLYFQIAYRMPGLMFFMLIVQLGLVIGFGFAMNKASASTLKAMFLLYAVTMGINLTPIAYSYRLGTIGLAFMVSAVYFFCLVLIGKTTKKDMTNIGMICLGGLIAMIIASIIMMFTGHGDSILLSIIGLLLFTGITVYDVQRAERYLSTPNGFIEAEKISIYMALQLYLDFINIFLYIVRILGSRKN